jgi:hypothetical protein
VYSKVVPNFVAELKQDDQVLTRVDSQAAITEGTFYYDIVSSTLYARFFSDADPTTFECIVKYRLFFADKTLPLSWDLENISKDVSWEGRITSSPGYKHKIGIDQGLTSLVGEGTLSLKNHDGGLDNVFDDYIFENQDAVIYSWNPDLDPSDARVIYRGKVTNKTFDENTVKFKIKDQIFQLLDAPNIDPYTDSDNVSTSVQGQYKRRVYGRVDGLRAQSIDQIADGIPLTGTFSAAANSTAINVSGADIWNEIVQGDTLIIGTQEFTVDELVDLGLFGDDFIRIDDETEFAFSNQPAILIPDRGSTLRNRTFLAAGHVCAEVTHNIVATPQFNRIQLDGVSGLFPGDFIEFTDTSERLEIKNTAPGNIVVLQQNVVTLPSLGTTVVRRPIQEVYLGSRRVNADNYTIDNSVDCRLTLNDDVEFNLTRSKNTVFEATFTNGSRQVTVSTSEVSLDEVVRPGDFVKPNSVLYTTFYKVVNVNSTSLTISDDFTDPTISDIIELKSVEYINDDSVVSVNILGKTVDGTATGEWITTSAQASKDLLTDVNITQVNDSSFVTGAEDATQLISMSIPFDFDSKTLPTVKDITDRLNRSVNSSLTLDNDLLIKYQVLNAYTGESLKVITDADVTGWGIKTTNGKTYKKALVRYRHVDVDLSTLENGNQLIDFTSQFVERYIGTNKIEDLDVYLYEQRDAQISAHRFLYYNSLGVSTLTIDSDLRLENVEIGDVVVADFKRLYKRKGDDTPKKVMLVIGKTVTGKTTRFELSDLGNTFNTSSYITPNDAPEWTSATTDEKLIYGYITDNQGIVNNEEDTAGTHLIS